ncbi:DUF6238 family protein [Streptomyces sp. NPDC026294]|uniref:DUF6238 family protein n=1 Tax=Streptomyces sp. NPDC026294 TaxID=3155362 RepID=UPI0033FC1782
MSVVSLDHRHTATSSAARSVRAEIDALHEEFLKMAKRAAHLAQDLDRNDSHAAGGRARAAVQHVWRGAEELHAAFHTSPPRAAGPAAPLARLCARRMRYLAARAARKAA